MSEIKLPEPKYFTTKNGRLWTYKDEVDQTGLAIAVFTADQMKAAILEERERWQKDAERYRWLASVCESDGYGYWLTELCVKEGVLPPSKREVDDAIDAAIRSQ